MQSLWKLRTKQKDTDTETAIEKGRQEDQEAIALLKEQQKEEYKQNWKLFQERVDKLEKEMQDEIIENNKKKQEQLDRLSRKREEFKTKGRQSNFDYEFNKEAAVEIRKKIKETIDAYFPIDIYSKIRRQKDIDRNNDYLNKIIPLPKIGSETIPSPKQIKDKLISYYKLLENQMQYRNPDDSFDEDAGELYYHQDGIRFGRLPKGTQDVYNFTTTAIPPELYGGKTRRSKNKTRRNKTRKSKNKTHKSKSKKHRR